MKWTMIYTLSSKNNLNLITADTFVITSVSPENVTRRRIWGSYTLRLCSFINWD